MNRGAQVVRKARSQRYGEVLRYEHDFGIQKIISVLSAPFRKNAFGLFGRGLFHDNVFILCAEKCNAAAPIPFKATDIAGFAVSSDADKREKTRDSSSYEIRVIIYYIVIPRTATQKT